MPLESFGGCRSARREWERGAAALGRHPKAELCGAEVLPTGSTRRHANLTVSVQFMHKKAIELRQVVAQKHDIRATITGEVDKDADHQH